MDKDRKLAGKAGLSRRDFLKVSAAGAAAAGLAEFAQVGPASAAITGAANTYHTTCPYCSASCGQLVAVDASGNVIDIYGDWRSPINGGGLCAKGAGGFQLAVNPRRVGAWTAAEMTAKTGSASHPTGIDTFLVDASGNFPGGVAYKRTGDQAWAKMDLTAAFDEIVTGLDSSGNSAGHAGLKAYRDASGNAPANGNGYHSKGVAFFGCSHVNNDQLYIYKKIICNFGTNNVEHQARI